MSTVRIQLRRGLEADWTSADTALNSSGGLVLAGGEVGLETDTGKFKFGDGTTRWSVLPYALENTLGDYVLLADVGQPNGVASLNSSGKVPATQLDISELSQDAVNTALVAGTGIAKSYDDNANTITLSVNATTSDISEGTNLYFTDERAQDAINTAIVAGTNLVKSYNDNANTLTISLGDDVTLSGYVNADDVIANTATIDGALSAGSITVSGDLVVNGTYSTVPTQTLTVENSMIYMAEGNPANSLDIGLVGSHTISGTYSHTGLVKDASAGNWKLFSGVVTEPGATVDFTTWTKDNLEVGGLYANEIHVGNVTNTEIQYLAGVGSNIKDQIDSKLAISTASSTYAPINNPTFTGTIAGISKSHVGLGNVDNTSDSAKPVSAATQTALDLKSNLEGPTFTGAVTLPSSTSIGDVSSTEIGYLNGVTSAIQTQLTQKTTDLENHNSDTTNIHGISDTSALATKTYADEVGTTAGTNLSNHASDSTNIHGIADTAALATKTYADDAVSTHNSNTTTAHGVSGEVVGTTNTQTLTNKTLTAPAISNPTGLVKADVGLGNVDNTSDASKPVSTATQTALDAKASLSGATFTGNVEVDGNLVVDGDFTVNGTNFAASATSITIEDNLVQLAHQNSANTVDLGIVVGYNDGAAKHSGIVRDVSADKWKLFKGVTTEPSTTVDFTEGSLDALQVGALEATTVTPSSGVVFTDGTQTKQGVPSQTEIIQKTASYTLSALTERDDLIEMGSSSAITLTIPTNATVAYPIGTSIDILQTSTGQVTIAGAVGVTVNATPGLKLRTQWSSATLFKRAENTWVVMGDLTA